MERLNGQVPPTRPVGHQVIDDKVHQFREAKSTVPGKEIVDKFPADNFPDMENQQGALGVRQGKPVFPYVAKLRMRVHEVLGVEIPVGEARFITAEEPPHDVPKGVFVRGDEGAVIQGEIEQSVVVVGRIGIELEKRVSEGGGGVAQIAAYQKQADGLDPINECPARQAATARILQRIAGQGNLPG